MFPRIFRRMHKGWGAFWLLTLGMTVGALLVCLLLAGDIYEYQDTVDGVHLPQVDAIVCLAGGRGRIAAAGDLWYRYWETSRHLVRVASPHPVPDRPPVLYISGMGRQSNWTVFTRQLRRGVIQVIKPEDVILETDSSNTEGNARWLADYAKAHGWRRILLITSSYHMRRARYIFDQTLRALGTEAPEIETLSVFQDPFEPGEWRSNLHGVHVTLLEYMKWIYYKSTWKP